MGEYQIAWLVAVIAGIGLTICAYLAVRKLRSVRFLVTTLVAVWLLMPWRFDDDPTHLAPAFIVLVFQGIFERDGEPGSVMMSTLWPLLSGALKGAKRWSIRAATQVLPMAVCTE